LTKKQDASLTNNDAPNGVMLKGTVTGRSKKRNVGDMKIESNNDTSDALLPKGPVASRSQRNVEDKKINIFNNTPDGLLLKGSITGRSRRNVGDKNIELVTYKICAGNNFYFVKDWAPKDYLSVGQSVQLPIYIKSFQKDGRVLIDYTVCSASAEEF